MLGSAFVVLTGYEVIAGLRTLQSRDAIESFLAEPPGDGLGLSVESVLSLMHVSAMVAAGCATAAGVLGFHVLQRHRGARVALAVLAVPLFVTGIVTGGFMSSLVAVASLMLWLQPARDWFDGKAAPKVERRSESGSTAAAWPPDLPAQPPAPTGPRAYEGFGHTTNTPVRHPPTGAAGRPREVVKRPDMLVVAAILTWVVAGFALVFSIVAIAVVASSPDLVLDEIAAQNPDLASQGISESALLASTYVMGGITAIWASLACACAAIMLRRSGAAARALMVSSALTAGFCFVGTLASIVLALPAMAAVVVVALLRRPDVRAWFVPRA